jgi:hypothetical protein
MSELNYKQPAGFEGFDLQIYGTAEDPLFPGSKVKERLNLSKINYKRFMLGKDYVVQVAPNIEGHMREQKMFTEHGLYNIIFRSRTSAGEKFREYVTAVLRDIRLSRMITSDRAYENLKQLMIGAVGSGTGRDLYIMYCRDRIKIGRSNDPVSRVQELQTGNPDEITLHQTWSEFGRYERLVHIHADIHFTRGLGEWFTPRSDDSLEKLVAWIEELGMHFGKTH